MYSFFFLYKSVINPIEFYFILKLGAVHLGIDTVRPMDNGALCGGGVFETKGCGDNDCKRRGVNNGGSDGIGSHNVIITNVRLNDYYFSEDKAKVGANIPGNYDCKTGDWKSECCFCKPNGIRSSQVGVWIPQTRDAAGTSKVLISDVVSSSSQADGINLHGYVSRVHHLCVVCSSLVYFLRALSRVFVCMLSLSLSWSLSHTICVADAVRMFLFLLETHVCM